MNEKVITRFAPSPTGLLHVGSVRTALFNYLHAKKLEGVFRLRIEDTDLKRSSPELTQKILDGLKWLGIEWEEPVVFQSANLKRHQEVAHILLEKNCAYRCFCTKQELENHRQDFRYNQHCRHLTPKVIQENLEKGKPFSIRFKVPAGITSWEDTIHSTISVQNNEIEDFVILRSDHYPTYQLAVVVDDHDMSVNWVIRGDDHISNTPKQILLYQAMEWDIPTFSHVPLILGPDKKRLSKRHGATSVEEYQQMGILPVALFNFLAILGWSPPDNREILSRQEIIQLFDLHDISRKSAVFDEKKLAWINQQHLLQSEPDTLYPFIHRLWNQQKWVNDVPDQSQKKWLLSLIQLLKPRATYLNDFIELARYFFEEPNTFDEKGLQKYFTDQESWTLLNEVANELKACHNFSASVIENTIRQFCEIKKISAAKIIHPLRLVLTGRTATPGLFEVMELLGKAAVLKRIEVFVDKKHHLHEFVRIDKREQ